jgi:hypothetical protein
MTAATRRPAFPLHEIRGHREALCDCDAEGRCVDV